MRAQDVVLAPLFQLDANLTERVATIAERHRERLVRSVQCSYSRSCRALVEDAVSAAIFDAILGVQHPGSAFALALTRDGERGLVAVIRQVAWRKMRGHHRLKSSQVAHDFDVDSELAGDDDPEAALAHKELRRQMERTFDSAAKLYAKRNPGPLRAALLDRMETGDSDPQVASRHGIRREVLTNARNWTRRAFTE